MRIRPLGLSLWIVGTAVSLASVPAAAVDTWTTPFPGVRHLHRTGPGQLDLHAAVVDLCTPGVSVRMTGFSERGKRTSVHAAAVGAQLAINGDFFCRAVDVVAGSSPYPPCVGKPVYRTFGHAAHDGNAWPEALHADALFAAGPGRAEIYPLSEHRALAPWMDEAISGHPTLVHEGQVVATGAQRDPRTALGLSQDRNTLILAVVDGRNGYRGASDVEMANLLVELGAYRGFNLDGGGSSTFWKAGDGVLNHPSDGAERTVGNHVALFARGSGPSPHCDPAFRQDLGTLAPTPEPLGPPGALHPAPAPAPLVSARLDAGDLLAVPLALPGPPAPSAAWVTVSARAVADAGVLFAGTALAASVERGAAGANTVPLPAGPGQAPTLSSTAEAEVSARQVAFVAAGGAGLVPGPAFRLYPSDGGGLLAAGSPVQVAPGDGDTAALALSVTALGQGPLHLFPCGAAADAGVRAELPSGFTGGQFVLAPTDPSGLCAQAPGALGIELQQQARFVHDGGLWYQPIAPIRLADTWTNGGRWSGRLPSGEALSMIIPGAPAAAALVLSVSDSTAAGNVHLAPCGAGAGEPQLRFGEGERKTTTVLAPLHDGGLCVTAQGRPHVQLDLLGLFVPPPETDAGLPPEQAQDGGSSVTPGTGAMPPPDAEEARGSCGGCSAAHPLAFPWLVAAVARRRKRPERAR